MKYFTYELIAAADDLIQFQRLVFRTRRIKRDYDLGEMYR